MQNGLICSQLSCLAPSHRYPISALQLPKITTSKENVEVFNIENVSVSVVGMVTTLNGNRVRMVCEVSGVPVPQITWERDGVEVQRGGKFYTIDTAGQGDNGNYSCIASNSAGEVKATSQLNILGNYVFRCFAC